jgi:hypothetical protein
MSNNTDFNVDQGADFVRTLTISDSTGTPIDLTGYTFAGQARPVVESPTSYAFTFTILNQISNTGKVTWLIPDTLFTALVLTKSVKYVYDIEMTDTAPLTKRILRGYLTISPEVTR